jgi:DNA-binding GntR family transcriptional regulator
MALSSLQRRVLGEIVAYARRENLPAGNHLREVQLAKVVGTSRFPVQAALYHLRKLGVVRHLDHRGYFLAVDSSALSRIARDWPSTAENPLYLKLAECRLNRNLPDTVTESELIRRFATSRGALRPVLSRIQQEGWVERRPGHGWFFLPLIDSNEAYEESYLFRLTVEPAGILSPTFRADFPALDECRKQQKFIADGGFRTMTPVELFEANTRFHETIAACSGNRFILQAVRRLNQLRRLVEYRQAKQRPPRQTHAREHLAILDKLGDSDFLSAATLMRMHLDNARREKARSAVFTAPSS